MFLSLAGATLVGGSPAAPALDGPWMTEEAMRAAFIGKTLDGHYGNGLTWSEAYFGDGRLEYRESARRATGSWHFRGHVFCTFYNPPLPNPHSTAAAGLRSRPAPTATSSIWQA